MEFRGFATRRDGLGVQEALLELARPRVIFHVDMNAFFAAVEQQFNPRLRGRPIVVCGSAKQRTVVAACSYEAKAFGITNGMSIGDARRRCPSIVLVEGNPDKYVDLSQRIFALLAEYTPLMEVFSIDEAFLDVTQTFRWFAPTPDDVARLMKQRIRQAWGLTCSVGIGPNKLIAKVASKLQKPDGLVRIDEADVPALMARLPIERLCGIGPNLQRTLNAWGIITCADLGDTPESQLVRRFGIVGTYLKRMGQGRDDSPVLPILAQEPVKSMGHAYTLPDDTPDEGEVLATLLRLSEQVARRLRADGAQARTVSLTIRYADFTSLSHARTVESPTDSGLQIYRVARGLYRRWCEPLNKRVRLVGVGVSQLSRAQRQLSWLAEERQLEQLDRSVDRINNRFGDWTVVRAGALTPLVPKTHGFLHKTQRLAREP
jgi:DNA polymerase-4